MYIAAWVDEYTLHHITFTGVSTLQHPHSISMSRLGHHGGMATTPGQVMRLSCHVKARVGDKPLERMGQVGWTAENAFTGANWILSLVAQALDEPALQRPDRDLVAANRQVMGDRLLAQRIMLTIINYMQMERFLLHGAAALLPPAHDRDHDRWCSHS